MNRPSSTITFAGIGGAFAVLVLWIVSVYLPEAYAQMPAGAEAALAVIFGWVVGYLKPEKVLPIKT